MKRIEDCTNWEEIFDFQSRADGANYTLLKEWLVKNYEVPTLKSNSTEVEFYETVYDILVKVAGAPISDKSDFVFNHTYTPTAEWRFCGYLGFGGTYRSDTNTIYCYREDMNDERIRIILEVNEKLQNLKTV